jgi:pullulanase/glycogen debranching enzyme
MDVSIKHGTSAPLGATVYPDGVNFSVFARDASAVELLPFEDERAAAFPDNRPQSDRRSFLSLLARVRGGPELHVGGFTRHPNSGVAAGRRGTYGGLIEKIPLAQGEIADCRFQIAD